MSKSNGILRRMTDALINDYDVEDEDEYGMYDYDTAPTDPDEAIRERSAQLQNNIGRATQAAQRQTPKIIPDTIPTARSTSDYSFATRVGSSELDRLNDIPSPLSNKEMESNNLKKLRELAESYNEHEQRATAEGLDMGIMLEVVIRKLGVMNEMYTRMKSVLEFAEKNS